MQKNIFLGLAVLYFECILGPLDAESSANSIIPPRISNKQQQILADMFYNGDFISDSSTQILDNDMRISFDDDSSH